MYRIEDFSELVDADISIDYSKIPQSFWDEVEKIMISNHIEFEKERKSAQPTHEDLHRQFDY